MRTRYLLALSLGLKAGIVFFCLSLLYVNKMIGQPYFNPTLNAAQLRQAVRETPNRDVRNHFGLTGLMFAAVNGELPLAQALFGYGAHLNLQSPKEKQTALHYATNNMRAQNSQNVGYYLVDVYANTMIKNKFGQIPLHLVISTDTVADRTKMVEYLVKNGSNINAQTNQGDTLMHLAVNMQAYNWVPTLLEQWASIINLSIKNKKGLTPAQYAKQLGFGRMVTVVSQPYPKVTTATGRSKNGLTGLMLAIMRNDQRTVAAMAQDKRALDLLSNDRYRNTALQIALIYQNVPAVISLLKNGANRMIKNARGEVPALFLVRVWNVNKKLKLAPLLLQKAPNAIITPNNDGNNLLHYIVQYDDMPLLRYVVKKYKKQVIAALAMKNKALQSPINLAAKLNRNRMGRVLISIK